MADLFDLVDLPSWLQVPEVDNETAIRVRRYASGWLKAATRLADWPTPVPDDLWAWAIELAGIAFYNPSGLSREQIDDYLTEYSSERREEILDAARRVYNTAATAPQYSFPEPDWHWTAVPDPQLLNP